MMHFFSPCKVYFSKVTLWSTLEAFAWAFPTCSFHSQLPSSAVCPFCRARNRATQTRLSHVSLPTNLLWPRTRAPRRKLAKTQ